MAPPTPKESLIIAAVLTELAKIGSAGPTEWHTNPPDATEGAPGDELPDLAHQLYLEHVDTVERSGDDAIAVSDHARRMNLAVVGFAKDTGSGPAELRKLMNDVLRALWAAEGTFQELTGYGMGVPVTFTPRRDLDRAGFSAGVVSFYFDFNSEHTAP